jgi:hypothetical protein
MSKYPYYASRRQDFSWAEIQQAGKNIVCHCSIRQKLNQKRTIPRSGCAGVNVVEV